MKIVTKMIEDELFEASNTFGNKVAIDMRKPGEKIGQSPVELLLSSLSACGAVDIVAILKKRKKTILAFTIETEAKRRESPPRSVTHLHCKYLITSPDVTEDELSKVASLSIEKYCSVAASLKSTITYSVEVIRAH
jgi:putative redox protein